ncbi:L-seryl-tRNA(Sec) selenium transferase [Rossellomorea aquimaris]|uniref:L-seryl-tRNA(Sec) selenium transferase n=1 Tax=Rossellomorea aquimaris TaxID=189382 RepID=UPI0007D07541|nr:L-seryl-tRNA(Sec) selenium transferase [Rossellomorea aquimaris]
MHQLRQIPPIHEIQQSTKFKKFIQTHNLSTERGTDLIKKVIASFRNQVIEGEWRGPNPSTFAFIEKMFLDAEDLVNETHSFSLQSVINASGTILHTNLGRARLGKDIMEHVMKVAGGYSTLEYDLEKGTRGSRHSHAEKFICELTGAEAAMVVNNNAAAVYMILSAFARNKQVIVSRGELVEIGGSFRISSIMEESGARLVEVGTTNKTHLSDYSESMTEETSMVMKVHQSNFVIKGFTSEVPSKNLVTLVKKHPGVIYYEDLGSGALFNFSQAGIGNEPVIREVIEKGVDLVSFSGDKLLGGPQAGIIAGKKELIHTLKQHQLSRVLRVDKMTLAALEMTLLHYINGEASERNPTIKDIIRSKEEILDQARRFVNEFTHLDTKYHLDIIAGSSQIGGGTMPEVDLDTYLIRIKHPFLPCQELHQALRAGKPSVVGRVQKDQFLLDLRTVSEDEQVTVLERLVQLDKG